MTAQTPTSAVEAQVRMQAEAWQAVVAVLDEVAPNWWDSDATGAELAVSTIRALAASQEAPKAGDWVLAAMNRAAEALQEFSPAGNESVAAKALIEARYAVAVMLADAAPTPPASQGDAAPSPTQDAAHGDRG